MPKITVVFGVLLCGLTVLSLIFTGWPPASKTVFIPCGFGVPLLLLGLWGVKSSGLRKHAMHAAAALGLLGGLGALGQGIPQAMKIMRGEDVKLLNVSMVWAMILICFTFVFVCIESFVSARRARLSQGESSQNPQGH